MVDRLPEPYLFVIVVVVVVGVIVVVVVVVIPVVVALSVEALVAVVAVLSVESRLISIGTMFAASEIATAMDIIPLEGRSHIIVIGGVVVV